MTKLKPLARLTYASAFIVPFFWTATGHAVPLFEQTVPLAGQAAIVVPFDG